MSVKIILPGRSSDAISSGLRMLTYVFERGEQPSGGFGGSYGYAFDLENDVFLMHPYCWCEKAGECPWCTGCAIYQDTEQCVACAEDHPHSEACYQTRIKIAKKEAGLPQWKGSGLGFTKSGFSYAEEREIENAIYDRLCTEHGLDRNWGCAVHCDCGANDRRKAAIDARGCDYQFGRGIFSRFAPWASDRKRSYYDPPNFWHKPSNFRVIWYKYIGRDMATNRDITAAEWESILRDCLASITAPPLESCLEAYAAAEADDVRRERALWDAAIRAAANAASAEPGAQEKMQ